MRLPSAVPELPVRNVDETAKYFVEKLGFTFDWGDDAGGIGGVSREDCRVFLVKREAEPVTFWLNLSSRAEVDALYAEWSGARVVEALEDKQWGLREFTVADPDGNRIRVFYDFANGEREG